MSDELIERLRGTAKLLCNSWSEGAGTSLHLDAANRCREAADEIERLCSLAEANNALARHYQDEIARMREALEAVRRYTHEEHVMTSALHGLGRPRPCVL